MDTVSNDFSDTLKCYFSSQYGNVVVENIARKHTYIIHYSYDNGVKNLRRTLFVIWTNNNMDIIFTEPENQLNNRYLLKGQNLLTPFSELDKKNVPA